MSLDIDQTVSQVLEEVLRIQESADAILFGPSVAEGEITTEVESVQLYKHGCISQVESNQELFVTQLQVARRAVQRV